MEQPPPVAVRFIEDFALALSGAGMPRTAGRIIGLLMMLDQGNV